MGGSPITEIRSEKLTSIRELHEITKGVDFGISIVTLEIINKIRTPFKSTVSYGCSFVAKLS